MLFLPHLQLIQIVSFDFSFIENKVQESQRMAAYHPNLSQQA